MQQLRLPIYTLPVLWFSSCEQEAQEPYPDFASLITEAAATITPDPLETIGGKVPVTFNSTIPPYFTPPTAEVSLSASIIREGGETPSQVLSGFIGEEVPAMGSQIIPCKEDGTIKAKCSFNDQPEMAASKLSLQFNASYKGRNTSFRGYCCDGIFHD